ncbi:LuxR family transcriptional regulator [Arthrobacter sedimenti]|uniref:LuxR C-terminal-related transcriptional regulator n=1 Tax=Arthrobacter sedimenti TaxID=2694931 RepID=UPI000B35E83B|nr:LuxR family transcriptional regulator [Arthrobacter sedimenti]
MRSHNLVQSHSLPPAAQPLRVAAPRPDQSPVHGPFIGRAEEMTGILRAVREPGSAGAVVVGAHGAGKTAVLQHVQRFLGDTYLIHVRGLHSAAPFPYRALSFLLSELAATVTHPALVFGAVSTHLQAEAGGRRVVFAVDNAEHLDRSSSALIGQLVAGNVASVILTVTDFAKADPAFMTLWRNASLRRFDLRPFTFADTGLFVESELGAPASRECVEALWAVGGGNLPATRAALKGFVQRGTLTRRGEAWVLLPDRLGAGQEVVGNSPLLLALTPDQRNIVNLVALAGALDWFDLARRADPADLDTLQDAGILVVDSEVEPRVRLATPGLSVAVAQAIGTAEALDLYQHLQGLPAASRQIAADPARLVAWLLRAALPVSEDQAVAAATALNDDGHYARATELIATLGTVSRSHRLAYQAVVAALGQGDLEAATAHLAVLATVEDQLDPAAWTLYKIEESRARRLRSPVDAAEPLTKAAEKLADWQREAQAAGDERAAADLVRLDRKVFIARAELASFEGRYRDNLETLPGLVETDPFGSADREEREFQVAVQSLLLEAQATVDQRSAGYELAQSLVRRLAHPDVSYRVADAALLRVETAFLLTGGWSEVAELLESIQRSSDRWSFRRGSLTQLSEGLAMVGLGRARDAVNVLEPVVEQLRVTDPHGILPLAGAALTYCHALASPLEHVIAYLPLSEPGRGNSWVVRRAARHYQLLASARTENRGEAARRLQERASKDLQDGASIWALVSLAAAVRLGRQEAVADLGVLAASLQGPLARACSLYSRALLHSDVGVLIEAMECAATSGDYRLVADIAQSGINATTRNQDRSGLRIIQRRLKELLPDAPQATAAAANLDLLTAREREVAAMAAAGSSNRVIAQKLFVSVRTVEGHLYQVYSKLSVSTRAELAELVPAESDF